MNYIKQLQKNLRAASAEILSLNSGLTDLVTYLNSSKFACGNELDGYVQINDVIRRIEQARDISERARYGV